MLSSRVEKIAATILEHTPELTSDGRRVALATYRLLAEGAPVQTQQIAEGAGLDGPEVEAQLNFWPGVFRDDTQRVVGYWGLSIARTGPHRLHVEHAELSAWCAWDTLFLPALLGRVADVHSHSPLDAERISLRVAPDRIEHASPANLVVSMVPARESDDLIRTFCRQIHFFGSTGEGERWIAGRDGAFLMPLPEAFDLAMRVNQARYGDTLAPVS